MRFFVTSKPTFYRRGDIVLRVGEKNQGAFFLKKGYVKDSSISLDGREFTLFIFQPEDVYSYSWIFNQTSNEHSFRALTDCTIYEKSREGFLLFLEQSPDVHFMITQKIVVRLRGLMLRIEHMAFGTATQKVSSIFSILSERFGKENIKGITIPIFLTQQDISELIGLSRETTSMEIKKLMDKNILSRASSHYIIMKPKALRRAANLIS